MIPGIGLFDLIKIGGGLAGGLLLAYVTIVPWARHTARQEGADAMRSAVERQNSEAATTARAARARVYACDAAGGTWDISKGACDR
jgi:hypothetical protein